MQSQQSLNKFSSNTGLAISLFLHAIFMYWMFFEHHNPKMVTDKNPIKKISLSVFQPAKAPMQAPEVSTPSINPEPTVIPSKPTPPKPPEPVKPKPKPKPVEKTKPKPKPKPAPKPEPKPEPVPEQSAPTPEPAKEQASEVSQQPASVQNLQKAGVNQTATAPTVGEFSIEHSAGDSNFQKIREAIKRHQKYPPNAKKMRQTGTVGVKFVYKTDGSVGDFVVLTSSGHIKLDKAAIESIQKARKDFPKLEKDYIVIIPIVFKLT